MGVTGSLNICSHFSRRKQLTGAVTVWGRGSSSALCAMPKGTLPRPNATLLRTTRSSHCRRLSAFTILRHYLASLLISSGADIKTVQARMRHASARTTLDIYGHLWPDADESTRSAVGAVIAERMDSSRTTADDLSSLRACLYAGQRA